MSEQVDGEADIILKYTDHGRQGREVQEQEEETSPEPAARQIGKYVRQRKKDKPRTRIRCNPVGKAGGDGDKTGYKSHEGIQSRHQKGLAGKTPLLVDIASEDLHAAHTETQGEEALVQCAVDHISQTCLPDVLRIRHQIEGNTLFCARQKQGMNSQHHHDGDQGNHHHLCDPLHAVLQSDRADRHRDGHGDEHAPDKNRRASHHGTVGLFNKRSVCPDKGSGTHQEEIVKNPSRHDRVKHQQHKVPVTLLCRKTAQNAGAFAL